MQFKVSKVSGIVFGELDAFDDKNNGITGMLAGGSVHVAIFHRATHAMLPGLEAFISGSGDPLAGNHRMHTLGSPRYFARRRLGGGGQGL